MTVLEDDWERKRREKEEEIAEDKEKAELERFRNLKRKDKTQGKDEKTSSHEEEYPPQADELNKTEEEMLMSDPDLFKKPPPIRVRDETSHGNATKRRKVTEEDSSQQEEWQHHQAEVSQLLEDYHQEPIQEEAQHQHAEGPNQKEGDEEVSSRVEEQHPHADKGQGEEAPNHVEDEHQHAVTCSVLETSQNKSEQRRVTKMMTKSQKTKQFQVAGTKTRIERKMKRKKCPGWNVTWWTKWWGRMEAEALSSAKLDQQTKITSFLSLPYKQDLPKADIPTKIHACEPKLSNSYQTVIKEHHPVMCTLRKEDPTAFVNGAKSFRGNKRGLENGSESPAKRNFSVNDTVCIMKVSEENDVLKEHHPYLKNATCVAGKLDPDSDPD